MRKNTQHRHCEKADRLTKQSSFALFCSGLRRSLRALAMTCGFATIVFFTAVGFSQSAAAVSLKQNSLIETDVITLGDVFAGLDDRGAKVLGPAPRPGHDMVLNARTLLRIALATDVNWRPASNADMVVLKRAATLVTPSMTRDALTQALRAQGIDGKFAPVITGGTSEIILPPNQDAHVEIESIHFDQNKNRFDAVLAAPSKNNPLVRESISGHIQRMVAVPVLRNTLKNGMVIGKNDIDTVDMRAEFVKPNMVLSADELIGMTPRRLITPGEPINENEIQAPRIVERGELVTMVFENGTLALTAQGKALQNGAKGDTIRVVNANSSRTLEARVTGIKEVTVNGF